MASMSRAAKRETCIWQATMRVIICVLIEVHSKFLINHRRAEELAKEFNEVLRAILGESEAQSYLVQGLNRFRAQLAEAHVLQLSDSSTESGFRYVTAEKYLDGGILNPKGPPLPNCNLLEYGIPTCNTSGGKMFKLQHESA
eukprot:5989448-Amphidinium_carterae.1